MLLEHWQARVKDDIIIIDWISINFGHSVEEEPREHLVSTV